jgi:cysteine desulfurase family protein
VKLADFFGAPSGKHVWFYQNATMALNQALFGYPFQAGDHVVTTAYEHNSVLRPLKQLKKNKRIDVTYVEPNAEGIITDKIVKEAITNKTTMIVLSHASNVTGAYVSIKSVAAVAKELGIILVVDASQTAGTMPIDMEKDGIDLLAFAGHKSLLGPQGIGVLISRSDYKLLPLMYGGTGSYSELEEQPEKWPDRYEAGTLNTPGIAGLSAGLDEIRKLGVESIYKHEQQLMKRFFEGVSQIESISCFGPLDMTKRVAVIPFYMKHIESHELAMVLDEHYQIAVRAGLHCSPKTHYYLKTVEQGLVRVSFGPYNTEQEVDKLIQALQEINEAFN